MSNNKPWEWLAAINIDDDEDSFDSILMGLELESSPTVLIDEYEHRTPFPDNPTEKARFALAQWHADQFETIRAVKLRVDSFLERLDSMDLEIVSKSREVSNV
tara:strand:+ start:1367 stop:1675 length:309 start_codon:yes stop_codon:yes gene_type:complete